MGTFKDLTGKVFGRLTVIEATEQRKQGAVVWRCKCECGKDEVYVSRSHLEQGYVLSCGCLQAENVAQRSKLRQTKDITGQKFGRLIAIEPTNKRENGSIVWKCRCDCENDAYVNLHNLVSNNTLSCGCLRAETSKTNGFNSLISFKENNYIAGTRMDIISNIKLHKNNTTGFRGVYFRKKDGKYFAHIEFQGIRYFLGSCNTKEEAAALRKEAEDKLYGNFIEWYNSKKIQKPINHTYK